MIDELYSCISAYTLVGNIVGTGGIDSMYITVVVVIEKIVYADTNLAEMVTEQPMA